MAMQIVSSVAALRGALAPWRSSGQRVALVPTMGNLHAGHLALVQRAKSIADRVAVSIFINPTQFVKGDDFDRYPRTPEHDEQMLVKAGADLLFAPSITEIYPHGIAQGVVVQVPALDGILCGEFRPGHFTGVATVITKLFNLCQPDVAVFGDKDYQQLLLIRRLVEDLGFSTEIVGVTTIREADGLALSSRNGYLSVEERSRAPGLYSTLCAAARELSSGDRQYAEIEAQSISLLRSKGFDPQYFAIRRAEDLSAPTSGDRHLVVLTAAWLGGTRLIDHIDVTFP